ncbi:MAG: helix-turn-helix domain-containing protein [Clostridium sp.]|nr:helix-turn-helix domain-containing protein [Clostridium sp.]
MEQPTTKWIKNFERIAELRKDRGFRQTDLARILGMSQRNYSHLESGEYDFSSRQLIRLASLFDVSIDYLVGLTDEKTPYPKSKTFRREIKKQAF